MASFHLNLAKLSATSKHSFFLASYYNPLGAEGTGGHKERLCDMCGSNSLVRHIVIVNKSLAWVHKWRNKHDKSAFWDPSTHPVFSPQHPRRASLFVQVSTGPSPICYTGHHGSAKRFREAAHHLSHVLPVRPEWIPYAERGQNWSSFANHIVVFSFSICISRLYNVEYSMVDVVFWFSHIFPIVTVT